MVVNSGVQFSSDLQIGEYNFESRRVQNSRKKRVEQRRRINNFFCSLNKMEQFLNAKTVPQLKVLCEEKDLQTNGIKAELIARLLEYFGAHDAEAAVLLRRDGNGGNANDEAQNNLNDRQEIRGNGGGDRNDDVRNDQRQRKSVFI